MVAADRLYHYYCCIYWRALRLFLAAPGGWRSVLPRGRRVVALILRCSPMFRPPPLPSSACAPAAGATSRSSSQRTASRTTLCLRTWRVVAARRGSCVSPAAAAEKSALAHLPSATRRRRRTRSAIRRWWCSFRCSTSERRACRRNLSSFSRRPAARRPVLIGALPAESCLRLEGDGCLTMGGTLSAFSSWGAPVAARPSIASLPVFASRCASR